MVPAGVGYNIHLQAKLQRRSECINAALYPPLVRSSCHLSLLSSFPPNLIIALFAPFCSPCLFSFVCWDFVFNSCRIIESFNTLVRPFLGE